MENSKSFHKPTQLYIKVFEDIWNKIKTGYYLPGDQLPTELAMEGIYGVSRAPIKQALGKLENAGLIVRRAGKGTFVAAWRIGKPPMESMGGFSSQYIYNWNGLRCTTTAVQKIFADAKVAAALQVQQGSPVIYVSRLRHVKDEAVFYLNHYIVQEIDIEKIKASKDFTSMRGLLESVFGLEDVFVEEEITVAKADFLTAKMLEIETNESVMFVKRFSYDASYKPICYSEYYVKPGNWNYRVTYSRKRLTTDL
jgi:DNA-binding GntR family transcriptional regulator